MGSFPDRASVEKLRYYGIRTVVLHTTMPALPGLSSEAAPRAGGPRRGGAEADHGAWGSRVQRVGSLVIYRIGPGPKALHATD